MYAIAVTDKRDWRKFAKCSTSVEISCGNPTLSGQVEEKIPSSFVCKVEGPEANNQRKSIRQGWFNIRDAAV